MRNRSLTQFCAILLSIALGIQLGLPAVCAANSSDFRSRSIILLVGSHHALVKTEMKQMAGTPRIVNETTLVPVRFVSEQFGAKVSWNEKDQSIELQNDSGQVVVQIGSRNMFVADKKVALDAAPQIIENSTYIPLRAISEALGKHVDYINGLILLSDSPSDTFSGMDEDTKDQLVNKLSPQKLTIGYSSEPPSFDSSRATSSSAITLINLFNEGLYRINESGEPTPALAKAKPVISDGGLTYTIKLREGLEWSDGAKVTAQDFVYAIQRTKDPRTKAQYSFMANWISHIEAKDEQTLVIELFEPRPQLTQLLAFPIFFPQRKDVVESQGDQYGKEAETVVGVGPFLLNTWEHGKKLTFERNPHYWDAEHIQPDQVNVVLVRDSITGVNLFLTGNMDVIEINSDIASAFSKEQTVIKHELTNSYVMFQEKQVPAFANANIRKALTLAIDREFLVSKILNNSSVAATGLVPAGTSNGNNGEFRKTAGTPFPSYSPDEAKTLLAKGLKELELDSLPPFTLISDNTITGKRMNASIVDNWKKILGIQVSSAPIAHAERISKQSKHDYEAAIGLWGADYNDPMTFLDMYETGHDFNEVEYSSQAFDDLLHAADKELDGAKRAQILVDAEKQLLADMPVAPLYFRNRIFLRNQEVRGMFMPSFGFEWELRWASKANSPKNP